jgi:DNA-binding PadR family transcriptional regulator
MTVNSVPSLTPAAFQVLLALAAGQAHGYAVMRFVEQVTAGTVRLGPGRCTAPSAGCWPRTSSRRSRAATQPPPHDARRRYYRLTPLGRQAVEAEAALLQRMVAATTQAGLLPAKEPT